MFIDSIVLCGRNVGSGDVEKVCMKVIQLNTDKLYEFRFRTETSWE